MITLARLTEKFTFDPDFVMLILKQDGEVGDYQTKFTNDQAARLLVLHEIWNEWRSVGRADLLKLYKELEWAFKNPPRMTYDKNFSKGFRFQVIPQQYLMRVELAKAGQ